MYVHTLMSMKNGGSESFANMKPEQQIVVWLQRSLVCLDQMF